MMNSGANNSLHSRPLSTLIGYITGPKAEQPVGVRVVEPPIGTRQYQRGNMYGVIELAGEHPGKDVIADRLLTVMQSSYYSSRGSQSQVIIEAIRQVQRALHESNLRHPNHELRAGILCAALLNGRLMVVTSGSALALVCASEQVHLFPSDWGDGQPRSLGEDAEQDGAFEIFRQDLQRDDVIFVGGGSWTSHVPIKALASIVAYTDADNCADAADGLYSYGGNDSPPGLLIVLESNFKASPSGPGATGSPSSGSPSPGSSSPKPRRSRLGGGGLPGALSAAPPARGPAPSGSLQAAQDASVVHVPTSPAGMDPLMGMEAGVQPAIGDAGAGATEETDAPQEKWPAKMTSVAAGGVGQAKRFLTRMLPDSSARAAAKPPVDTRHAKLGEDILADGLAGDFVIERAPAADAGADADRRGVDAADDLRNDAPALNPELSEEGAGDDPEFVPQSAAPPAVPRLADLEREDLERDDPDRDDRQRAPAGMSIPPPLPEIEPFIAPAPASGTRARVFILLALLILALVPTIVFLRYWEESASRRADAEQLTDAAEGKLVAARSTRDLPDKSVPREALLEAKEYLATAITLDGSTERRNQLAVDIEQELQDLLRIQPLYQLVAPLISFPPEARPQRVLVADGGIYVLDTGRQAILLYRYDPASEKVLDDEPQTLVVQGQAVDGVTVGSLADMAWMDHIPGVEDRSSLLILDRNNNLFRYDPRVEGAGLIDGINGAQDWRGASQVQSFGGRIYVADEGLNQIFRYNPTLLQQAETPPELDPWFSEGTLVNLAGTISMEIDGDIWLLMSSGNIMRYNDGEQVPFALENSVAIAKEPVDMYVTKEDREEIYLADAGEDYILVYSKDGAYEKQLRAAEGDPLSGLSGIFIDETAEKLFILTKTSLYSHPLP